MPALMRTGATRSPRPIFCIGDSLTQNYSTSTKAGKFWPGQLATKLVADSYQVKAINLGISGNTTTNMLARIGAATKTYTPIMGFILGGVNDPGNGINSATTTSNISAMVDALVAAGVPRVVIVSAHYLNFAGGVGDTQTTDYAAYVPVRAAQLAAYTASVATHPGKVAYCDLHAYLSNLIATGVEVQNSASWHVGPTDQHPNELGSGYFADAIKATITAESGWLDSLR